MEGVKGAVPGPDPPAEDDEVLEPDSLEDEVPEPDPLEDDEVSELDPPAEDEVPEPDPSAEELLELPSHTSFHQLSQLSYCRRRFPLSSLLTLLAIVSFGLPGLFLLA